MPRENVRDKLDRFITNDFHHLSLDVANLRGQLKIILMVLGVITVATVGELVAIVIQGVIK